MIITVTLNPAVDRTIEVPNIRLGRRLRSVKSQLLAGGKGINVARTLKHLGEPVVATGLAGGTTADRIEQLLRADGVLFDFVRVRDESRRNISLVDHTSGQQTEINERGPAVGEAEIESFRERLSYLAGGASFCVISGSVPPGLDNEIYAKLVADMTELGVPVLLDADGDPMRAGLRAEPELVAPNVTEAEDAVGHEFGDEDDLDLGLAGLVGMGAGEAIITQESGCAASLFENGERRLWRAGINPLEPVSTSGSGDAFVAGFVASRRRGRPASDCLRYAVACGAESTQHFGAGNIDRAEVERLVDQVEVSSRPAGD